MDSCSDEAAKKAADTLSAGDLQAGREALVQCLQDFDHSWNGNQIIKNTRFVNKVIDQMPAGSKIDILPVYDHMSYLKEFQLKPRK